MTQDFWVSLSESDRVLLRKVLAHYARENGGEHSVVVDLLQKLEPSRPYPDITIGVHGGQVQWTTGNPFPLRICDYDGDKCDLPDLDKDGEWCRQWFEPADEGVAN
ncbi:MAG: hypothetical protein KGJ28_00595 [Alphaproteobacteria bacterium]|nr:hypothetical protein [Alphaproteobacteria bacterium]